MSSVLESRGIQKKLFTPGPLLCSDTVKAVMLRDLGSRDVQFVQALEFVRSKLLEIAGVDAAEFTAIPVQGSGTYAVEATIQTATSRATGQKVLVLANGAYGERMQRMCEIAGIENEMMAFPEYSSVQLAEVEETLQRHQALGNKLSAVAVVHHETTSGIVNDIKGIGRLIQRYQPQAFFIVDAMSSFGAVPINMQEAHIDFLAFSSNKCLQGVPGLGFVICRREDLLACKGNSRVLTLDLVQQFQLLDESGQFRFTPPTHVLLALQQAIRELEEEGGIASRAKRYQANYAVVQSGMKTLGFKELLPDGLPEKGYIITSFHYPAHPKFHFDEFYQRLSEKGQLIYQGKVTSVDCFRIGHIGHLFPKDMGTLVDYIRQVLGDMQVTLSGS